MVDALSWAASPAAPTPPVLTDGMESVAEAGARALCREADVDYDACTAHAQAHYRSMSWRVFLEMWDAAVEADLTVHVEHVTEDGDPLPEMETP